MSGIAHSGGEIPQPIKDGQLTAPDSLDTEVGALSTYIGDVASGKVSPTALNDGTNITDALTAVLKDLENMQSSKTEEFDVNAFLNELEVSNESKSPRESINLEDPVSDENVDALLQGLQDSNSLESADHGQNAIDSTQAPPSPLDILDDLDTLLKESSTTPPEKSEVTATDKELKSVEAHARGEQALFGDTANSLAGSIKKSTTPAEHPKSPPQSLEIQVNTNRANCGDIRTALTGPNKIDTPPSDRVRESNSGRLHAFKEMASTFFKDFTGGLSIAGFFGGARKETAAVKEALIPPSAQNVPPAVKQGMLSKLATALKSAITSTKSQAAVAEAPATSTPAAPKKIEISEFSVREDPKKLDESKATIAKGVVLVADGFEVIEHYAASNPRYTNEKTSQGVKEDIRASAVVNRFDIVSNHILSCIPEIPVDTSQKTVSQSPCSRATNNYGLLPKSYVIDRERLADFPEAHHKAGGLPLKSYVYVDAEGKEHTVEYKKKDPSDSGSKESAFFLGPDGRVYDTPGNIENNDYNFCQKNPEGEFSVEIADGCSWGSFEVARIAAETAQGHFDETMKSAKTIRDIARNQHEAYAAAQENVIAYNKEFEKQKTTTLATGTVVKGAQGDPNFYGIFTASGDVKVVVRKANGTCLDATPEARESVRDPKDPGGRLGPQALTGVGEELGGDYRNFRTTVLKLEAGDTVMLLTDGTHDNCSPPKLKQSPREAALFLLQREMQKQGLPPLDFSQCSPKELEGLVTQYLKIDFRMWDTGTWKAEGKTTEQVQALSQLNDRFTIEKLAEVTDGCKTPEEFADALDHHAELVTQKTKVFMHENPGAKEPADHTGKMDNNNKFVFTVG